ncbi:MAG: class I SAM-dependent methyltransferase [Candidatus Thorarchaeota archaeon]|jgi:ubiquinone/menaquinone biosynthesis C-methylase UbiE
MRKIKVLWRLFKIIGNAMRTGRQTDQFFRYFVVKTLDDIGFFEYLCQPRTFGEIMSSFQFEDGEYAQEVLETLELDKKNLILNDGDRYVRNKVEPMPDIDQILGKTDPRLHQMSTLAEAMQDNILERMRKEKVGVKEVFERNQKRVVNTFNQILSGDIYSTVRELCFDYLLTEERIWLLGKHLLEIGCGSGLETAELWLLLNGKVKITAVDTVPSMLELAETQFEGLLKKMQPDHPEVTKDNRPSFEQANAISLPYPDGSFDAVFWSMMLHWTSDPAKAIKEAARVLKPGGLIFGSQPGKPQVNPYSNLVIRSSRDSYGFFWKDDLIHWMADCGIELDNLPPINIFRARKPLH